MVDQVCHASIYSYPGGGCWGVSTGSFKLGYFRRVQVLPGELLSDAQLRDRAADAGPNGYDFIRRLQAIPNIGPYIMLNGNGFTFGMKNHREAPFADLKNLQQAVFKAFCEVYGFKEMSFS